MKTGTELLFEAIRCYGGPEAEQYARQNNEFPSALRVSDMFSWDETPQGYRYWYELSYKTYKYSLMYPRNRLAERIEHELGEPEMAQYVRIHGQKRDSDDILGQFIFNQTPYGAAWYDIAARLGQWEHTTTNVELGNGHSGSEPTVEPEADPDPAAEPELWWQTRDREAREQRDRIIALRNSIRDIHGL